MLAPIWNEKESKAMFVFILNLSSIINFSVIY